MMSEVAMSETIGSPTTIGYTTASFSTTLATAWIITETKTSLETSLNPLTLSTNTWTSTYTSEFTLPTLPTTGHVPCVMLANNVFDAASAVAPDPDIGGVGVLTAFLVSAWLSIIILIVAYILGMVPKELLTPVDERIYRIRAREIGHWGQSMQDCLRSLSDQQIVTGVAVLVAGFAKLGSISIYHYQTVIYLAWMASNVHLTTLTLLRGYLQSHHFLRAWRVTGMLILFIMLCIALVPTSANNYGYAILDVPSAYGKYDNQPRAVQGLRLPGAPVICFWQAKYRGWVNPDSVFSYITLIASYIWKVSMVFESTRVKMNFFLRIKPRQLFEHALAKMSLGKPKRLYIVLLGVYLLLVAVLDWLESLAASIWFLTILLSWGTLNIVLPREIIQNTTDLNGETTWTFGQILTLLLLVLPLLNFLEPIYDTSALSSFEKSKNHSANQLRTCNFPSPPKSILGRSWRQLATFW
ncbi:hypothetical protein EV356DRAFT_290504 [Viridothelium virens]|uniref:Uncharacterized protein n=1 Tax=Viridothelium virens TaxID=1048519 RepID=A0A6A6H0U6_VIRVR|nr:hypothetical protein EV356DRAFT_290504 [Viridothelium virens]